MTSVDRSVIRDLIQSCLETVNEERSENSRLKVTDETPLLAEDSKLDSLELVAFLTDLETRLSRLIGRRLSLAADALTSDADPFRDVASLNAYLSTKLLNG